MFIMKRKRNAFDAGQQTLESLFQALQGDSGRVTRARPVQLAQPSMEAVAPEIFHSMSLGISSRISILSPTTPVAME